MHHPHPQGSPFSQKKKTLWKYLSIDFSPISEIALLYERYETSPVCPSENITAMMQMGGER
jgi:hypothetical protein